MRDPVERFLSYYFFRRYHAGLALRNPDAAETERWLQTHFPAIEVMLTRLGNYQTAFLAAASFFKPATCDTLNSAIENLQHYHFVCFTERTEAVFPA